MHEKTLAACLQLFTVSFLYFFNIYNITVLAGDLCVTTPTAIPSAFLINFALTESNPSSLLLNLQVWFCLLIAKVKNQGRQTLHLYVLKCFLSLCVLHLMPIVQKKNPPKKHMTDFDSVERTGCSRRSSKPCSSLQDTDPLFWLLWSLCELSRKLYFFYRFFRV